MMISDESLMMLFDASLNPGVNPDSIAAGSAKKLNWRCIHDNRHVFSMSPLSCMHVDSVALDGSPVAYEVHGKSLECVDCIDGRDSVNIIIGSGDYMFRL